jgi:hypothetical protein
VQFELVRSEQEAKFHRHYFAAWIEDEVGRRIRILALWAKGDKVDYARDLNTFWRNAWVLAGEGSSPLPLREYSRATRAPDAILSSGMGATTPALWFPRASTPFTWT